MDLVITPNKLHGKLQAIASKSHAHRLLICAAFADSETTIICKETNRDIDATVDCLRALGAVITKDGDAFQITPVAKIPTHAELNCCESGSTLRFMLPIIGALGVNATIHMEGRLPQRPLSPLWEEMERMGCRLSWINDYTLSCSGKMCGGTFRVAGNVSSQFITGLLYACACMHEPSRIEVIGKLESKPYVQLTQQTLQMFGIDTANYEVAANTQFVSPGIVHVEGDWSNAAYFLAANALGSSVSLGNLNTDSAQGDKAIVAILEQLETNTEIDVSDIPDLVPTLSVVAAAKQGATFKNIQRLRMKESDRVASVIALLQSLGADAQANENTLTVFPHPFTGGIVDTFADHRIAMAAAVAATASTEPVTILHAQCVEKSYPSFWNDYKQLGGSYEQYIR